MKVRERPQVIDIYSFCSKCIEKNEETNSVTKEKTTKYYFSIERFQFACDIHQIAGEDREEAFKWASQVAQWATEAPDIAIIEARRKRWGR